MQSQFFRPLLPLFVVVAMVPASPNYQLETFEFGSGGVGTSSQYQLQVTPSESATTPAASPTAGLDAGLVSVEQANVPPAPSLTNANHDYSQLLLVLDTGSNASDAEFLVAISTDEFVSDTRYVTSSNAIGTSQDWRTASGFGSGSGISITGLVAARTYTVKVKARHGLYTESGFGPTVSTDTNAAQLSFGNTFAASNTLNVSPETSDTTAGTISAQTNADRYVVTVYADNGGGGANPRNATTGAIIANNNGFSPPNATTATLFTSGNGFAYRLDSVTGSEIAAFDADAYKSFAYGTPASHADAVAMLRRQETRPAWNLDQATMTLKVRTDWSTVATTYQTTVYFEVTPTYDSL